ncbi:MAG: FimB/Mfa2 family fimbrial subunit [Rikenellaceae bacterium]|nr:FimB/Mfa2 family fimbrial subunit [Rikenellaceae bacterium]
MRKPNTKNTVIFTLAAILIAGTSCVHDGLDDCPPETGPGTEIPGTDPGTDPGNPGGTDGTPVTLYVDFAEKLYTRTPAAEVSALHVFVFDHDGYYVTTLEDREPLIGGDYAMDVPLEPGDYEFIGWTNIGSSYAVSHNAPQPGVTTLGDLYIELDILDGDTLRDMPDHLHHGLTRLPSVATDTGWEYVMEIDRYTYTVNIVTEGLGADDKDYRYVIADRNGRLSIYNEDISERTIYYVADCDRDDSGQLSASLRVIRLLEDHLDSRVYIENRETGELLFSDNLIGRLLSLRDIGETVDFSTRFEYTIKLVFDRDILVSISVNDWIVWESGYEI